MDIQKPFHEQRHEVSFGDELAECICGWSGYLGEKYLYDRLHKKVYEKQLEPEFLYIKVDNGLVP